MNELKQPNYLPHRKKDSNKSLHGHRTECYNIGDTLRNKEPIRFHTMRKGHRQTNKSEDAPKKAVRSAKKNFAKRRKYEKRETGGQMLDKLQTLKRMVKVAKEISETQEMRGRKGSTNSQNDTKRFAYISVRRLIFRVCYGI